MFKFKKNRHQVFNIQEDRLRESSNAQKYFDGVKESLEYEVRQCIPSDDINISVRYTSRYSYKPESGFSGWEIYLENIKTRKYALIDIGQLTPLALRSKLRNNVKLISK